MVFLVCFGPLPPHVEGPGSRKDLAVVGCLELEGNSGGPALGAGAHSKTTTAKAESGVRRQEAARAGKKGTYL